MKCLDFDWQINEFMVYCRSTQLREKSMASYEQTLRLFERWCADELRIFTVDKVTEPVIRKYINDLQERGKYTFYVNDQSKKKNYTSCHDRILSAIRATKKVHRYENRILYLPITSSLHCLSKRKSRKGVAAQSEIPNLGRLELKLQFVCDQGDEF